MKKVLIVTAIILAAILIISLVAFFIGREKESEKWKDYYGSDEVYNINLTKEIEDFPGAEFIWTPNAVSVKAGGVTNSIIFGFPVWNVFFSDITGDGFDDICITVSVDEEGVTSDRIVIKDYQNNIGYEVSDPGNYNFRLKYEKDALIAIKESASDKSDSTKGKIIFNGVLMKFKADGEPETTK